MNKFALPLGLSLAAFAVMSCSGDDSRYSTFSDESGTYRMNETTGEIHQVLDGKLVKIAEDGSAPEKSSHSQAEVIEDFGIAIRFLDGGYEESAGEYGILECVQGKTLDASLSVGRTRAELADALDACMRKTQWFEAERPAPVTKESDIPLCDDGRKELDSGATVCISDDDKICDRQDYMGDGVFTCD